MTNWFQTAGPRQIQFSKYTRQDFVQIQSLGCDVIRLPINLHFMTSGAPDYTLDPLFLSFLDQAVDWAEDLGLHLILDNHSFDPAADTDPNVGFILEKVWVQMATHFKDRSTLLYYEVLNEPHGISDAAWNTIQQQIVTAIRTVDDKHTIIVGPAGWNSFHNLAAMPAYQDNNLIYTFHFYDPFLFTHQGASWSDPSMQPLANVPFPYQANAMPNFPATLNGTWIQSAFNNYANEGTLSHVKELIDVAVAFRDARNVPVFCGEFGVYIPNSPAADRTYWYKAVRTYLEEKNIPWTIWDYHGGFGLFEEDGNDLFEHDLNTDLLVSLGFDVPEQTVYELRPDSTGFLIYSDFIGQRIFEASYNDGNLDFYHANLPHNDAYSLFWTDALQYNNIGFDFRPNKDLSYLLAHDYALDFFVKGDRPGTIFDIRFIDTKTNETDDHPWRIRVTIDDSKVNWDNQWHHLHIPLTDFKEHGAWDNGWFNPIGAFDWTAIDRLEIVAEHSPMTGRNLWFDNIQITNVDPTIVSAQHIAVSTLDVKIYPNPVSTNLIMEKEDGETSLPYELLDSYGRVRFKGILQSKSVLPVQKLPNGPYWISFQDKEGKREMLRFIKQ
ncbi:MAG: cellulase family glycosylhydrolase [Saprospiraceae bacterium]